ncbi:MAG: hypothetical protein QF639_03565 [Rhodospirillales bacterium]|nr:hypothetical protein [Rhodospirillales bacterium]MDP7241820.1 hypothetical protein [Rhodospirillales bacterium]
MGEQDRRRLSTWAAVLAGAGLFLGGLLGGLSERWGWGLFLASALFLVTSLTVLALLVFTARFEAATLARGFTRLFVPAAWCYVWGFSALGGFFVRETLFGRIELRWIVFGLLALAALIVIEVGLYKKLYQANATSFGRWRRFLEREDADPKAARRTFVDEVVLHKTLFSISRFRWLRHTLIFWGFALMVAAEGLAVVLRDVFLAYGYPGLWEEGHPLRLSVDFLFDLSGLSVLVGCVLALVWRVMVNGTEEERYADTPSVALLLVVVLTGFVVEGIRLAAAPFEPHTAFSFVGAAIASLLRTTGWPGAGFYDALWLFHIAVSCLFIAYVPVKRLVHSCATPMGRLMYSQKRLLEAKRRGVVRGLLGER